MRSGLWERVADSVHRINGAPTNADVRNDAFVLAGQVRRIRSRLRHQAMERPVS